MIGEVIGEMKRDPGKYGFRDTKEVSAYIHAVFSHDTDSLTDNGIKAIDNPQKLLSKYPIRDMLKGNGNDLFHHG